MESFFIGSLFGMSIGIFAGFFLKNTEKNGKNKKISFSIPAKHYVLIYGIRYCGKFMFSSSEEISIYTVTQRDHKFRWKLLDMKDVTCGKYLYDIHRGPEIPALKMINKTENDCEVVLEGDDILEFFVQNPKLIV